MKEEKPKEEIITIEDLKKNIEFTLRELKSLINPLIDDEDVEIFVNKQIIELANYNLLQHETVNNTISGFKIMIKNKDKVNQIIEKLLLNIREAMLFKQLKELQKNDIREP